MIELTENARFRYDDYMRRMRSALGRKSDAEDIEQSVREHVEVALAGTPGPVAEDDLARVLERLGPPERWLAEEPRSGWRRILDRIQNGPDTWRLSYLTLFAFVFGFVFPPLMLASYVAARAYVELLRERGEHLGARRWLVYPPIAFLLAATVIAAIIGPAGPVLGFGIDEGFERVFDVPRSDFGQLAFYAGMGAVLFGAWWMLLAGLCSILLRPIRFVFAPLLDGLNRKHFAVLSGIGTVVGLIGGAVLYQLYH